MKFPAITGLAICFILASYAGCNRIVAILFFSFASGFAGLDNSRVNNLDLSPNYAPTICAIVNSFGSIMGTIAPFLVGLLTPNVSSTLTSYHHFRFTDNLKSSLEYNL